MEGPEALATVAWQPSSTRWLLPRGKVLLGFLVLRGVLEYITGTVALSSGPLRLLACTHPPMTPMTQPLSFS